MESSRDLGLPPYPSLASGPGPKPLEPAEKIVTLSSLLLGVGEASLLFAGNWGSSLWSCELSHALICEWVVICACGDRLYVTLSWLLPLSFPRCA